jgi:hypothetical protein
MPASWHGTRPEVAPTISAHGFGTMLDALEDVIRHAGTRSKVRQVPKALAKFGMRVTNAVGISPIAAYHALM